MAKTKAKSTKSNKKTKKTAKAQPFNFTRWVIYSFLIVGEMVIIAAVWAGYHEGVSLGTSFIQFVVGTVFIYALFTWIASKKS